MMKYLWSEVLMPVLVMMFYYWEVPIFALLAGYLVFKFVL